MLPYKIGTNSGIPSTAFSLDTDVICSDIPMFSNNTLIPRESLFKAGSVESLSKKMLEKLVDTEIYTTSSVNGRRIKTKEKYLILETVDGVY